MKDNIPTEPVIKYFGFGTNKDRDMMEHMVGRKGLLGEPAKLPGYQVCPSLAKDFRKEIPPDSPSPYRSAYDILANGWGPDFEMYCSVPDKDAVAYGTLWYLTPLELALCREWELVDYGCQEDAYGVAITESGDKIPVITQSFMRPPFKIHKKVDGSDYPAYVADKAAMLKTADESRESYIKLHKQA